MHADDATHTTSSNQYYIYIYISISLMGVIPQPSWVAAVQYYCIDGDAFNNC